MRLHRALAALAALVALAACEENAVQDITGPAPNSGIRFFNFGINAPAVHFYAGDQKLTASSSTSCQSAANPPVTANDSLCHTSGIEATAGIAYGGVTTNGNYVGIEPGQYTFDAKIMAAADKGRTIASASTTIVDGKVYSYYVSGFYNTTTKTADAFIIEDNFPTGFDFSTAYVRFINASPNSQPMTLHLTEIGTSQRTMTVGGAIAYKSTSEFIKVPPTGYNLALRTTGSSQNLVVRENIGFEAGGVYTITLRGDMTVTSTTATNRPFLDNTINR